MIEIEREEEIEYLERLVSDATQEFDRHSGELKKELVVLRALNNKLQLMKGGVAVYHTPRD